MAIENMLEKKKKNGPFLEILQGGKFDNVPLIRKAEKLMPKVKNTSDVKWLFGVHANYNNLLRGGELKPEEEDAVEAITAATAERLSILGHSVMDQKDHEFRSKTEKYNL